MFVWVALAQQYQQSVLILVFLGVEHQHDAPIG
jgi:hypothetical protein